MNFQAKFQIMLLFRILLRIRLLSQIKQNTKTELFLQHFVQRIFQEMFCVGKLRKSFNHSDLLIQNRKLDSALFCPVRIRPTNSLSARLIFSASCLLASDGAQYTLLFKPLFRSLCAFPTQPLAHRKKHLRKTLKDDRCTQNNNFFYKRRTCLFLRLITSRIFCFRVSLARKNWRQFWCVTGAGRTA